MTSQGRPPLKLPEIPRPEADGRTNGHAEPEYETPGRGSRIANRTPWLQMPEPWDNLEVRVWLDFPQYIADLWTPVPGETPDQAEVRVREACKYVFLEHRGVENHQPWEDDDGVLPDTTTDEFWERISTPLGGAMVTAWKEALQGNPTNRASRRKKRKSWSRA